MNKFTVGQEVQVSGGYGKPRVASIEKIGRKYVTILGTKYDIETQQVFGGYSARFQTVEQIEESERRAEVWAVIRAALDIQTTRPPQKASIEFLEELAAVVTKHAGEAMDQRRMEEV